MKDVKKKAFNNSLLIVKNMFLHVIWDSDIKLPQRGGRIQYLMVWNEFNIISATMQQGFIE